MTQSFVKILYHSSAYRLGDDLQSWLADTAGQLTITHLSLDSNEYGHCLTVLYTPGSGPTYAGQIWFDSSHSSLEDTVNQELKERSIKHPFMTHGSNKYGHCLCLITET